MGWTHWPWKVQISGDMQEPSCIPPTCAGVAEYSFPNLTVQGLKAQLAGLRLAIPDSPGLQPAEECEFLAVPR